MICSVAVIIVSVSACKDGKPPCRKGTHCTLDGEYCQVCPNGTFNDQETIATECQYCRVQCGQKEFMKEPCNVDHDMICECETGYYKEQGPTYGTCLPIKKCPPSYGVKRPGTSWNNTVCERCEKDKFSPDESATQICSPCSSCPSGEEVEERCTASRDTKCRPEGQGLGTGLIIMIVVLCVAAVLVLVLLGILYRRGKLPCIARQGTDKNADEKMNLSHGSPSPQPRAENGTVPNGIHTDYDGLRVNLPHSPGENSSSRGSTVSPRSFQHQNSSGDADSLSQSQDRIPPSFSFDPRNPQRAGNRHDSGGSGYSLQRAFTDLSTDLCSVQWEMFFRRLIGEGSDAIINKVRKNYPNDVQEQIYQLLTEWHKLAPDEAKLENVIAELEDMGENLLASKYKQKLDRSDRTVVTSDSNNSLV